MRNALILILLSFTGCQFEEINRPESPPIERDPVEIPTTLSESCFDYPDTLFGPNNWTNPTLNLPPGSIAIDFTLLDVDGEPHTLSELLATKPVVVQTGSLTSPEYRNNIDATNDLQEEYGDDVHFVDIYTVEAYPETAVSPYKGEAFPLEFSDIENATTYEERLANATALSELSDRNLVLVDDLSTNANNPFWCTFANAPNAAFVIDQEGTITSAQVFYNPEFLEFQIQQVLP